MKHLNPKKVGHFNLQFTMMVFCGSILTKWGKYPFMRKFGYMDYEFNFRYF